MMKPEVLERHCREMREKLAGEPKTQRPLILDEAGDVRRLNPPSGTMSSGGFGAMVCLECCPANPPAEDVARMFQDAEAAWVN